MPLELAALLEGKPRVELSHPHLDVPDYDADVLIIGGGGAGCAAAIEANNTGAKVLLVTKLRMGDANTMMQKAACRRGGQAERLSGAAFSGRLRRRAFCRAEGPAL